MGEINKEVMTKLRQSLNGLGEVGLRLPMRHQLIQGARGTPSKNPAEAWAEIKKSEL